MPIDIGNRVWPWDYDYMPSGYHRDYDEMDDGRFYWHLYCRGERVNGGLAETQHDAEREARRHAFCHNLRSEW